MSRVFTNAATLHVGAPEQQRELGRLKYCIEAILGFMQGAIGLDGVHLMFGQVLNSASSVTNQSTHSARLSRVMLAVEMYVWMCVPTKVNVLNGLTDVSGQQG